MKFVTSLLLLTICITFAASFRIPTEYIKKYSEYLKEHNKSYTNLTEFETRFNLFIEEYRKIEEFNKDHPTFTTGPNFFSDMTEEEQQKYLGVDPSQDEELPIDIEPVIEGRRLVETSIPVTLPRKVDWNAQGIITPVKNQGTCGSCTMHTTSALVEAWLKKKVGLTYNLSEQHLIDCARTDKPGCSGSLNKHNMDYMMTNGLVQEYYYPYTAVDGTCKTNVTKVSTSGPTYTILPTQNLVAFLTALSKGPVATEFYVNEIFKKYAGGVFDSKLCDNSPVNHAVLAIGYDLDAPIPYILFKNSWGTTWGEKGFFRMSVDLTAFASDGPCGLFRAADSITINWS